MPAIYPALKFINNMSNGDKIFYHPWERVTLKFIFSSLLLESILLRLDLMTHTQDEVRLATNLHCPVTEALQYMSSAIIPHTQEEALMIHINKVCK